MVSVLDKAEATNSYFIQKANFTFITYWNMKEEFMEHEKEPPLLPPYAPCACPEL